MREISGNADGVDIEGLAVTGTRVFVGMRGPVLRGWAVIVEFNWKDAGAGLLAIEGGKIKKHCIFRSMPIAIPGRSR